MSVIHKFMGMVDMTALVVIMGCQAVTPFTILEEREEKDILTVACRRGQILV